MENETITAVACACGGCPVVEEKHDKQLGGELYRVACQCGVAGMYATEVAYSISKWNKIQRLIAEDIDLAADRAADQYAMVVDGLQVKPIDCKSCGGSHLLISGSIGERRVSCEFCGVTGAAGIDDQHATRRWNMINIDNGEVPITSLPDNGFLWQNGDAVLL